jgi:hypothetical protein
MDLVDASSVHEFLACMREEDKNQVDDFVKVFFKPKVLNLDNADCVHYFVETTCISLRPFLALPFNFIRFMIAANVLSFRH